jgi:hypothetical protein
VTLSRRVALLIPLAVAFAGPALATDDPMTTYRKLTTVEPPCNREPQGNEIIVCARRDADRYRLPLSGLFEPGDPKTEGLMGERERLQHITTPCDERGPFLIGCGAVGLSVSTAIGGEGGIKYRPLAP